MRHKNWTVRIVGIAVIAAIFVAGFGAAVWQLWNLLIPKIFGLPALGFWQAVGLLSSELDLLRELARIRPTPRLLAISNARALGADDARGA